MLLWHSVIYNIKSCNFSRFIILFKNCNLCIVWYILLASIELYLCIILLQGRVCVLFNVISIDINFNFLYILLEAMGYVLFHVVLIIQSLSVIMLWDSWRYFDDLVLCDTLLYAGTHDHVLRKIISNFLKIEVSCISYLKKVCCDQYIEIKKRVCVRWNNFV